MIGAGGTRAGGPPSKCRAKIRDRQQLNKNSLQSKVLIHLSKGSLHSSIGNSSDRATAGVSTENGGIILRPREILDLEAKARDEDRAGGGGESRREIASNLSPMDK